MTKKMTEEDKVTRYINHKLRVRGFSQDRILNSRPIIGAVIEELMIVIGLSQMGIGLKDKVIITENDKKRD